MTRRQNQKTSKRSPFYILASPGTFCALVIVATLGSLRVNGEKGLCSQWKDGEVSLLTMGILSGTGTKEEDPFVILDENFNGFKVPIQKFKNFDNGKGVSLDLAGAESFNVDAKYNLSKPESNKGYFIHQAYQSLKFGGITPSLGYFPSDHKLTLVPLKDGEVVDYNLIHDKHTDVFLAGNVMVGYLSFPSNREPAITLYSLDFPEADKFELTKQKNATFYVKASNAIENGYLYVGNGPEFVVGYGISNQNKEVNVFTKDDQVSVPYADFFNCIANGPNPNPNDPSNTVSESKGFNMMVIIIVVVVIVVVLIGVAGFFWLTKAKKPNSLDKKTKQKFDKTSKSGSDKRSSSAHTGSAIGMQKSSAKSSTNVKSGLTDKTGSKAGSGVSKSTVGPGTRSSAVSGANSSAISRPKSSAISRPQSSAVSGAKSTLSAVSKAKSTSPAKKVRSPH